MHVPVTALLEDALLPEEMLDDDPLEVLPAAELLLLDEPLLEEPPFDDELDELPSDDAPDSGDALFSALSLITSSSVVMLSPCDAPAESDSGNAKARIALAPVTLKAMTPRPATAPTHVPIAARCDGS